MTQAEEEFELDSDANGAPGWPGARLKPPFPPTLANQLKSIGVGNIHVSGDIQALDRIFMKAVLQSSR